MIQIEYATGPDDINEIRSLFIEYQKWLNFDLCFQGFEDEINNLPGKYEEPEGCLLLARDEGRVAGGVGMWPLSKSVCEMKRLFVRTPWRGTGLGRRLAEAIIQEAKVRDYDAMRLDTLPQLTEALGLYSSLGFAEIDKYYENPLPGVKYFEMKLEKSG